MCGRYASTRSREDLLREFEIDATNADEEAIEPDYNVAPTKTSPVVLARPPRDDQEAEPVRQLRQLRWGLVPAWSKTQQIGKGGKPLKQPFYLHPEDDDVLALAGLYEFWRDKDKPSDDPDAWLITFTIITTTATDDVGHIHDRMPMTIAKSDWEAWLDPRINDVDDIRRLMAPPPQGSLDIYAVTTAVNSVKNNGPELLEPLQEAH